MAGLHPIDLQSRLEKLRQEGEERSAERLSKQLGVAYVDLTKMPISLEAVRMIPEAKARDAKMACVEIKGQTLALAAVNPELPAVKAITDELHAQKYETKLFIASASGLEAAWRLYKFVKAAGAEITGKVEIQKKRIDELHDEITSLDAVKNEFAKINFADATPIAIMELMLAGASALRASDVHVEAEEKKAKIRFRIDGLLHDVFDAVPLHSYLALVSRLKLLSGMKLNVRDEAQDGRFTMTLAGREMEMRVSVIPAEFGETVVMRILDPAATLVGLPDLGLRPDNLEMVKAALAKPNGLLLNTGPTGSGKTTTLYAFLRSVNNPELKIITLEDPIEYRLEGIEQTQVDEESGYTFANGLRAIVRQDPDVVLVGEIRDLETADIALQAALTGHLVFSTLHANDAIGAVPRLVSLGVKPPSIGPALALVIAQRLVRVLCPDCKKQKSPDEAAHARIKNFLSKLPSRVAKAPYENVTLYTSAGCTKCNGIGYKGRVGIFEFLEGGAELEKAIMKDASEVSLREVAAQQQMVTMQEDGILKVLEGKTTFEEVESVTGPIRWE